MSDFEPSAVGLAIENLFKPMYGKTTDTAAVERLKATLEGKMAGYEAILSKTQFLAGDEITLADLFHLPCGSLLEKQGIDYLVSERWPNVARWWNAVSSRESWKKVSQA